MIDWFSGPLGYNGLLLKPGSICELSPEGEIKWTMEKKIQVRGSYEASVQVGRTSPTEEMIRSAQKLNLVINPVCLTISGNPSKFLQGHNVFGPSVSALAPVMQAVVRSLPDGIRPDDSMSELWPAVSRSRVDITTSIDLSNHDLVHDWLKTAENSTRSRHGRPMVAGQTVYWGKHSTRWTMKAYCKFCELKQHPISDRRLMSQLMDYCMGQLRIELCLRRPELKNRGTLSEDLIWEFMKKIEVGVMKKDVQPNSPNLSPIVQYTLARWMAGEDVRHKLFKTTFYRHRQAILEELGLDISLNYEKKTAERICFDLEYLRAHEIKIPPIFFQAFLFKPKNEAKLPFYPAEVKS
jgi:hypothetical protein